MYDVDYVVIGAGAAGLAFTDELLEETEGTVAIVDRNPRPGGHWNDAYPFVRLHLPSAYYGVNTRELGSGRIETAGLNRGYHELATGAELLHYFEGLVRDKFLPSGRVRYFPMSSYSEGQIVSTVSGAVSHVRPRKTVDATLSNTSVPATRKPPFQIGEGIICRPVNDLPRIARPGAQYVIIGAGKTGMDACCWLLEQGADPDAISWIMPRDYWLLDRANYQPGEAQFARRAGNLANEVQAIARAGSVEDVFHELEALGVVRRLDPTVRPLGYHGAIVSDSELEQLRRIKRVVRSGRVMRIESDRIVLEQATFPTNSSVLHIDCSASGVPPYQSRPIFQADRIYLQWVRASQPIFSAALIGFVEATYPDDVTKNRICQPIAPTRDWMDWIRMMAVELDNRYRWSKDQTLSNWIAGSRLDGFAKLVRTLNPGDTEAISNLQRYAAFVGPAAMRLRQFLAEPRTLQRVEM